MASPSFTTSLLSRAADRSLAPLSALQFFTWWQQLENFHADRLDEASGAGGASASAQEVSISFVDACAQEVADAAPVQASHLKAYKTIYAAALDSVR